MKSKTPPSQDPTALLLELYSLQERLAKALPTAPRLRASAEAARNRDLARVDEVKDFLVQDVTTRATTILLVGVVPADEARFVAALERNTPIVRCNASAPYYDHIFETVRYCGGTRGEDGTYSALEVRKDKRPHQFTAEHWHRGVAMAEKWKEQSFYGKRAWMRSELHQPMVLSGGTLLFADAPELARIWKKLLRHEGVKAPYRLANPDLYGQCSVLDSIRQAVLSDKVIAEPIVIVTGIDSVEEADNLAKLFTKPAIRVNTVAPNAKELRKQVEGLFPKESVPAQTK